MYRLERSCINGNLAIRMIYPRRTILELASTWYITTVILCLPSTPIRPKPEGILTTDRQLPQQIDQID